MTRLIVNMGRRFAYPFVPAIARELGAPLASVQSALAFQGGTGMLSPLFGPLSERYGRRRVMIAALLMMGAAALVGALLPRFWVFAAVIIALGVSKFIFDSVVLATIGDRVPYHRRGLAIGFNELSWAGALIVAGPLVGFLLAGGGLPAVFFALAVLFLLSAAALWRLLPADHPAPGAAAPVVSPLAAWRILRANPVALAAVIYVVCLMLANEMMTINYSAWMEARFQLDLAQLGAIATVAAAGEVAGEFAVIGLADRLGKKRLALLGVAVSSLCYVSLPAFAASTTGALALLFLMYFSAETAIVASIPLYTEIMPGARAIMMSGTVGGAALGRLSGAFLGGVLYAGVDQLVLVGAAALGVGLMAFVIMSRLIPESVPRVERADGR